MKNIFKCVMIIIGTLIGAGFASGQEIATFFNRFYDKGLYGLILSCILFGIIIFIIMERVNKYGIEKYENLINNNKFILFIMKIFSFICFCIMISAIGSFGKQEYNVSFWVGAFITGIVSFLVFLLKFAGLEKINNILVPLILGGITMLGCVKYDANLDITIQNYITDAIFMNNWLLSAFLYTGYNSILLVPILVELKQYRLKRNEVLIVSILAALFLAIAGILIYGAINTFFPYILSTELPTLILANTCGIFIKYYYRLVILFAIFTTAFSSGYSFLKMNSKEKYFRNACFICLFGVILSRIGFSKMINMFFPIFGFWGMLLIAMILFTKKREDK